MEVFFLLLQPIVKFLGDISLFSLFFLLMVGLHLLFFPFFGSCLREKHMFTK